MKKISYIFICSMLLIVSLASCNDVWDKHYQTVDVKNNSELSLYAYMQTQPELSKFCEMLRAAGYDAILSKPNTYTVWAPINAALSSVNLADKTLVKEIVENHISRFAYPTSGLSSEFVYMLADKFVVFKRNGAGFNFGGKDILIDKSNVATSNGVLHLLNGYVPYTSNIWEFIGKTAGLDSLRTYLYEQSKYEFIPEASVEIGTNEYGQAIYDSVIKFTNPVLAKIGAIHLEDSIYTAILPNNTAWIKAYNKIKNNYKTFGAGGEGLQRLNTQWAIVTNLIFKKEIADPATLDSLVSTTGNVFKSPNYLFENSIANKLSNGYAYVTDSIRFKAEDSYQQKVKVEAENSSYGRSSAYANLYIRSSLGSAFNSNVSDNKYLMVEANTVSVSTQNSVSFPIPNTLSGKYNIYCVFAPSSIANVADHRSYKYKFYFSYMGSDGKQVTDATIDSKNTVVNKAGSLAATFTSQPDVINKVFVTQFTFPYCNSYTKGDAPATITTRLKVENAARITESVLFDRSLRIDYIVLEPVQ